MFFTMPEAHSYSVVQECDATKMPPNPKAGLKKTIEIFYPYYNYYRSKFPFRGGGASYSVLKLFTGLANAAFIACMLTDNNAINNASDPAIINIDAVMSMR